MNERKSTKLSGRQIIFGIVWIVILFLTPPLLYRHVYPAVPMNEWALLAYMVGAYLIGPRIVAWLVKHNSLIRKFARWSSRRQAVPVKGE